MRLWESACRVAGTDPDRHPERPDRADPLRAVRSQDLESRQGGNLRRAADPALRRQDPLPGRDGRGRHAHVLGGETDDVAGRCSGTRSRVRVFLQAMTNDGPICVATLHHSNEPRCPPS